MKTLKYIAVICLAGLFLGACVKEEGLSQQNKGKTKPAVTLTLGTATDGLMTVTIAADASASQYGYVIFSGDDNSAPAAYDIVIDEVGGVEQSEVFSYADGASNEITFECDPNASYQIFAAAITKDGLVGEVTSLDVFVKDTVNPDIVFDEEEESYVFESDESVIYLQYTEPVTYVKDKEITAKLYPGYSYDSQSIVPGYTITVVPFLMQDPVGTAKADVTVDEDVVILDFGDLTPGTYYVISIPAGAFKDGAGNVTPAFESKFVLPYFYRGVDALGAVENNVYGVTSNAPFALTLPEMSAIDDLSAWIEATAPQAIQDFDDEAEFVTVIKHVEEKDGAKSETTTTYPMTIEEHFAATETGVNVRPAGTAKPKDAITITIPAGALMDIYGNTNAETVIGPYQYAYTPVYPNTGVYSVTSAKGVTFPIELAATSEDPEGPYIMYGTWFGQFGGYHNPILYLTVNEEARTLTCDGQFIFNGSLNDGLWGAGFYYIPNTQNKYYFSVWGGGDEGTDPVVFTYGDDGNLTTMSYFEYGVSDNSTDDYLGAYDVVQDDTPVTRVVEGESAQSKTVRTLVPVDFATKTAKRK